MNNYTFSTLNDKDFEEIVLDLLNQKFDLALQSFKTGKDKGVDLRYSTPNNSNSVVVQCKHYLHSTFSQLKSKLRTKELPKVKKLQPDRYILITSLPLSAADKDELTSIFKPFILAPNDIHGRDDLNTYLREFPEIEKTYFKLWFSSTAVFQTILNNAIEGRTKYLLEKIGRKIPLYVLTDKVEDSNRILDQTKLLLITGQPGVGKTTLAELLLFQKARNGYRVYCVENVREAEDMLSHNPEEKQLFYLDDFLGANYFEVINSHRTETQLTAFIERVRYTPNKLFILTTRTVILNHALEKYEKLSLSKIHHHQFELRITDYTRYEKALILYNHLFFNGVSDSLYDAILTDRFYNAIISHKNYTPRIMEFITDHSKIQNLHPDDYIQFIKNNLDNPKDIWKFSFNNQISHLDRCLLLTMLSFQDVIFESKLSEAFAERLQFEKEHHNQTISSNQLNASIKVLLNGFISSQLLFPTPASRSYQFINPSLADFLIGYLNESFLERKDILSSFIFIEQLERFDPKRGILPVEKELQVVIRDRIDVLRQPSNRNDIAPQTIATYLRAVCRYCPDVEKDQLVNRLLQQLIELQDWGDISSELHYFLQNISDSPLTIELIKAHFAKIISWYISYVDDLKRSIALKDLFEKFGYDFEHYAQSEKGKNSLISLIDRILTIEKNDIESRGDEFVEIDEVADLYFDLNETENTLRARFFRNIDIQHDFETEMDTPFWEHQVTTNRAMRDVDRWEDDDGYHYGESNWDRRNDEAAIDDLFTRQE